MKKERKKLRVGVLMGGPSSEYDISLNTGEKIFRALDRGKYIPVKIILTKGWKLKIGKLHIQFPTGLLRFDVIFNAFHGTFGEDGTVQTILDLLRIPYTGSTAAASFVGMDKFLSDKVFRDGGLLTPRTFLYERKSKLPLKLPFVVKPRRGGSSVGIGIVRFRRETKSKVKTALKYDNEAVLQEYVKGEEYTCGVLENKSRLIALPVVLIKPKRKYDFFDYEAKYIAGASEEIVPAPISKKLTKKIQKGSLKAHRLLGCRGYSRSDFIVSGSKLYFLEINTLPGLTENSLLPKEAAAAGIPFAKLLDCIILSSISKK